VWTTHRHVDARSQTTGESALRMSSEILRGHGKKARIVGGFVRTRFFGGTQAGLVVIQHRDKVWQSIVSIRRTSQRRHSAGDCLADIAKENGAMWRRQATWRSRSPKAGKAAYA